MNKTTVTTNEITEINAQTELTFTKRGEEQGFTVSLKRSSNGENPFETFEDAKGDTTSAEFYLKGETALILAAQILTHLNLKIDWEMESNKAVKEYKEIAASYDDTLPVSGAV